MSNKCLDDELFDIYMQDRKTIIKSLREIYDKGREDAIMDIPSTEPKTGHWTERKIHEATGFFLPTCSECGQIQPYTRHTFRWNYCPNCGAMMVEPQERSE